MPEYRKDEVYRCADPTRNIEVTVNRGCTGESCSTCGPLICCDKPMVRSAKSLKLSLVDVNFFRFFDLKIRIRSIVNGWLSKRIIIAPFVMYILRQQMSRLSA